MQRSPSIRILIPLLLATLGCKQELPPLELDPKPARLVVVLDASASSRAGPRADAAARDLATSRCAELRHDLRRFVDRHDASDAHVYVLQNMDAQEPKVLHIGSLAAPLEGPQTYEQEVAAQQAHLESVIRDCERRFEVLKTTAIYEAIDAARMHIQAKCGVDGRDCRAAEVVVHSDLRDNKYAPLSKLLQPTRSGHRKRGRAKPTRAGRAAPTPPAPITFPAGVAVEICGLAGSTDARVSLEQVEAVWAPILGASARFDPVCATAPSPAPTVAGK